jgi:hypothetical protein
MRKTALLVYAHHRIEKSEVAYILDALKLGHFQKFLSE